MSTATTEPRVTCAHGLWQGEWADGYVIVIKQIESPRVGICNAELEVFHGGTYLKTLGVDFLSPRSQEEFGIALGALNGVAPVLWPGRLSQFYYNLHQEQNRRAPTRTPTTPLAPPLPAKATPPAAPAAEAAPWLDAYVGHSAQWSPRAASQYHAAIGLWMLSTIAARRIMVELGSPIYPNLFLTMVSRSTLYAKTTTAKIGRNGLRQAGCGALLASDRATPQALLRAMAGAVPNGFGDLDPEDQLARVERVAFAAQRRVAGKIV